jgi:hypothetical protein
MCLEEVSTSEAWECLPSTASDTDPNSRPARFLDSSEDLERFVHMMIVEKVHEDQPDGVRDTVFDLVLLVVAETEAAAVTELALEALVVVLGGIHSSCPRWACFLVVVKDIRQAAEEAVAASPPAKRKAANS